jgi:hypothetical protein
MEMPSPSAGHSLAGSWRGQERIHPSPMAPAGGTAVGRVKNVSALDGFAVIQDYEQERGGRVNLRGHGIFRFDPAHDRYVLHWFDSFGGPPAEFHGRFEGETLTVIHEGSQGRVRASWDLSEAGRYAYHMEVSPDGRTWTPFMEGTYTREV